MTFNFGLCTKCKKVYPETQLVWAWCYPCFEEVWKKFGGCQFDQVWRKLQENIYESVYTSIWSKL